jgi:hypothetical protein
VRKVGMWGGGGTMTGHVGVMNMGMGMHAYGWVRTDMGSVRAWSCSCMGVQGWVDS